MSSSPLSHFSHSLKTNVLLIWDLFKVNLEAAHLWTASQKLGLALHGHKRHKFDFKGGGRGGIVQGAEKCLQTAEQPGKFLGKKKKVQKLLEVKFCWYCNWRNRIYGRDSQMGMWDKKNWYRNTRNLNYPLSLISSADEIFCFWAPKSVTEELIQ